MPESGQPRNSSPNTGGGQLMNSVAAVLDRTCNINSQTQTCLTIFSGQRIPPGLTVMIFTSRMHRYGGVSPSCYLCALVLMDRIARYLSSGFLVSYYNVHRLFGIAVLLSAKMIEENLKFNNERWAQIVGISLKELNILELESLKILDWRVHVSPKEYRIYHDALMSAEASAAAEAAAVDNISTSSIPTAITTKPPTTTTTTANNATAAANTAAKVTADEQVDAMTDDPPHLLSTSAEAAGAALAAMAARDTGDQTVMIVTPVPTRSTARATTAATCFAPAILLNSVATANSDGSYNHKSAASTLVVDEAGRKRRRPREEEEETNNNNNNNNNAASSAKQVIEDQFRERLRLDEDGYSDDEYDDPERLPNFRGDEEEEEVEMETHPEDDHDNSAPAGEGVTHTIAATTTVMTTESDTANEAAAASFRRPRWLNTGSTTTTTTMRQQPLKLFYPPVKDPGETTITATTVPFSAETSQIVEEPTKFSRGVDGSGVGGAELRRRSQDASTDTVLKKREET